MILVCVPVGPTAAEVHHHTCEVDEDAHIEEISIDEINLPVANGCWSPIL